MPALAWPTTRAWPTLLPWPCPLGVFHSGQSNSGNQDGTAGTTDARVSLVWSNSFAPGTFNGPAPMAMQSGGHSFEWQESADLAAKLGNQIVVAKYWADGTTIDLWVPPGNIAWIQLEPALRNFAQRCRAVGVSQVEYVWCQGESNTPNNVTGLLATFQANTISLFDGVKAVLEGYGLRVHFTIIMTNPNIVTGPNPTDPSAANLTAVRGFQTAIAAARTDTGTLDPSDITPGSAGAVHYINGQTNVIGSREAVVIATRLALTGL